MSNPLVLRAAGLACVVGVAVTPLVHAGPVAASAPKAPTTAASAPKAGTAGISIKKPIVPADKPATTNKVVVPAAAKP